MYNFACMHVGGDHDGRLSAEIKTSVPAGLQLVPYTATPRDPGQVCWCGPGLELSRYRTRVTSISLLLLCMEKQCNVFIIVYYYA